MLHFFLKTDEIHSNPPILYHGFKGNYKRKINKMKILYITHVLHGKLTFFLGGGGGGGNGGMGERG